MLMMPARLMVKRLLSGRQAQRSQNFKILLYPIILFYHSKCTNCKTVMTSNKLILRAPALSKIPLRPKLIKLVCVL